MKRVLCSILIVSVALVCMGMGSVGGYPEGTVPKTEMRIQAKLIDRGGISTTLNQFSMDGRTYLNSMRGYGQLTVPFDHIANIIFGDVSGNGVKIEVKMKSGNSMNLAVDPEALFYGSTGFGAFQIKASDVGQIQF